MSWSPLLLAMGICLKSVGCFLLELHQQLEVMAVSSLCMVLAETFPEVAPSRQELPRPGVLDQFGSMLHLK
jgi:hypothetical protein